MTDQRPDPAAVLSGLKDFQRRTVEHVHRRFYLDEEATERFLVADEVGLGKTHVAKGVTALALDHLWEQTKRLDVVYICSNAEIAQQNIRRLRVVRGAEYSAATRLSLLPREIHGLRDRKLNFVSLTPGTSFETHSAMGRSDEREMLYVMLEEAWGLRGKRSFNVFCGSSGRDGFERRVKWLRRWGSIDEELWQHFLVDLEVFERDRASEGKPTLQQTYEALLDPYARRQRDTVFEQDARDDQREMIAVLRRTLAHSCVNALEPDLVILDEFQKFRHLLNDETEAGELAQRLLDYRDAETGQPARTLLLSATPYRAYATSNEGEDSGHYEDFLRTASFLLDDEEKVERLGNHLSDYRRMILHWGEAGSRERLRELRGEVEGILSSVIARTERLADSPDRDGMLREIQCDGVALTAGDLRAYLCLQSIARDLEQHDTLEYWKSAPYLLNLMDGYKLKREFSEVIEEQGTAEHASLAAWISEDGDGFLSPDELDRFDRLDPGNARMRNLAADTLGADEWQLLWMPPSLPYYELSGPYEGAETKNLTKQLVFSSWAVVPKAISLVLSYIADREMTRSNDPNARNGGKDRDNRGGLLRIGVDREQRLLGMPVLGFAYPSFALAELVDPLAPDSEERPRSRADAIDAAMSAVAGPLAEITAEARNGRGRDERWFWAAPILLDRLLDPTLARRWLRDPRLPDEWAAGPRDDGGGVHWSEHVGAAAEAAAGELELGSPPEELAEILALLAVASPAVVALRALSRGWPGEGATRDPRVRLQAAKVAWSFRALFNQAEVSELVRGLGSKGYYWQQALGYCADGCLQSTLDELVHVQREALGHGSEPQTAQIAAEVAQKIRDVIGIRSRAAVDFYESDGISVTAERSNLRARFALRFGDQTGDDGAVLARSDSVRTAFNSPFWPFVLASTSVGQEGLDFHLYSHAVTHWNLPSNPVDLEQREGRIHRYKGHAVRKNLANAYGQRVLAGRSIDPWREMFELAEAERPDAQSELWPYWVFFESNGDGRPSERSAVIERHAPTLPLSRDRQRLGDLRQALTLYRTVLGQARQEDLVELLASRVREGEQEEVAKLLKIDLRPPAREPLVLDERPGSGDAAESIGTQVDPDEVEAGPSPLDYVSERWPAFAEMELDDFIEAYETGSDGFQALLRELASHPDEPHLYSEVDEALDGAGRVGSLFGGYSARRHFWDDRRPFHFGGDEAGNWWIWMDRVRAEHLQAYLDDRGISV